MANETSKIALRGGTEPFRFRGEAQSHVLSDFWRWYCSDLVGNALRGVLAEYIVAAALGCTDTARREWEPYDLITKDGIKVEVKSAAYVQSWAQSRPSTIRFDVRPSRTWDYSTNKYDPVARRDAHVYVFALLDHQDIQTVDPLNLDQWRFYVTATKVLDTRLAKQKSIGLRTLSLLGLCAIQYHEVEAAVRSAAASSREP